MYGYLLRLTETNGYTTPWTIFSIAGIPQNHTRPCALPLLKLARVANRNVEELKAIAYRPTADLPRIPHLLGHRVRLTDLRLGSPHICPSCIQEKGFIEAHWDLGFMIACPIHRCLSTVQCSRCQCPLSWFRQGLLECRCGAALPETRRRLPPHVCDLLDVLRRRVLGLDIPLDHPLGIAAHALHSSTLYSILGVIRVLGS
jgi:hypothetical protein